MSSLRVEQLRKAFSDEIVAIESCDLSFESGVYVVVVGPSGCGKTTLLRLIAGLDEPTRGAVFVNDQDVTRFPPHRRDVAMIFQDFALYPHMSVRANLAFPLRTRRVARAAITKRVDRAASILRIRELLDRKPGELSGGERQRVALGRVLVVQPGIALLDEPLSHLDAELRAGMREELRRFHKALKRTVIHVTHDQEEAMALADRIVIMAAGRVQQVGPPDLVYRAPANRFVASFLGRPPMNFIPGRIEWNEGLARFASGTSIRFLVSGLAVPREPSDVVLGVRPHDLYVCSNARADRDLPLIAVTVVRIETIGDLSHVKCETVDGDHVVITVWHDEAPSVDEVLQLSCDHSSMYLFEPGPFGAAIHPPAQKVISSGP